jgi:hypothetical protein
VSSRVYVELALPTPSASGAVPHLPEEVRGLLADVGQSNSPVIARNVTGDWTARLQITGPARVAVATRVSDRLAAAGYVVAVLMSRG